MKIVIKSWTNHRYFNKVLLYLKLDLFVIGYSIKKKEEKASKKLINKSEDNIKNEGYKGW